MTSERDPDPYKVLQVDSEAEEEVIQAAYRRLAQKYHPDRAADPDSDERMKAINAAWALLRDPAKRAAYDLERRQGQTPRFSRPSSTAAEGQARGASPETRGASPGTGRAGGPRSGAERPPETVSRDWTTGRSDVGGGYDPGTMRAAEGLGAAGPPPGSPSGSVLTFGRYSGWSLGEIARHDLEYIEWLDRMPIGRSYRDEIDAILRRTGRRESEASEASNRHGLFRRR